MGNYPSPQIILFTTYNFGSVVFTQSILLWIMHNLKFIFGPHKLKPLSMVQASRQLLMQEVFLQLQFIFFPSLLFLPNFDLNSFSDSHTIHFAKIEPLFLTSTFRWCLFLNLLITDCEIPPMLNSLLIYRNVIQKSDQITKHITSLNVEN